MAQAGTNLPILVENLLHYHQTIIFEKAGQATHLGGTRS